MQQRNTKGRRRSPGGRCGCRPSWTISFISSLQTYYSKYRGIASILPSEGLQVEGHSILDLQARQVYLQVVVQLIRILSSQDSAGLVIDKCNTLSLHWIWESTWCGHSGSSTSGRVRTIAMDPVISRFAGSHNICPDHCSASRAAAHIFRPSIHEVRMQSRRKRVLMLLLRAGFRISPLTYHRQCGMPHCASSIPATLQ